MAEENIFDSSTNEGQTQDNQAPTFQIPTEAAELVGQGKKYQSVEEALKSVPHAQRHIQTLEQEMAQLKEELAKRKTAEELLDEIKQGIPSMNENTTQSQQGIDPNELAQVVNQTIEFRESQRKAKENASSVASKFTERFGEKAEEAYNQIAREAGLTIGQLNTLAATSPNAVLKLAGLSGQGSSIPSKTNSSVRTEALGQSAGQQNLSAKVPKGASTRDLVNAWKIAGEKVKQNLS